MDFILKLLPVIGFLFAFNNAFAGKVSLSFDDAPMRGSYFFSGEKRTEALIKTLTRHQVSAVFYVNTDKIDGPIAKLRLNQYDRAGHFLGNHTHSHPSFDETSLQDYIINFEKAHNILKKFKSFRPWFRYPYLRHGKTSSKLEGMRKHIKERGYEMGFATIDTLDWYINSVINNQRRVGGHVNNKNLCRAYADIIFVSLKYFDDMAKKHLGRSPAHSLLLHENDLAALCLNELIVKIKENGFDLISPELAMEDEIYQKRAKTFYNNNGVIAALIHEKKGIKISDPWSNPGFTKVKQELKKRGVYKRE